jgi:phosphoesterase RecJ-like protein
MPGPTATAIGSQVAVARILAAHGIEVFCANGDPVPRRLAYLRPQHAFYNADTLPPGDYAAVLVDCADLARVGPKLASTLPPCRYFPSTTISAPAMARRKPRRHPRRRHLRDHRCIAFDLDLPLDDVAAKALYAGILTDNPAISPCLDHRASLRTRRSAHCLRRRARRGRLPHLRARVVRPDEAPAALSLHFAP